VSEVVLLECDERKKQMSDTGESQQWSLKKQIRYTPVLKTAPKP
jgi:hypothetical protein